MLRLIVAAGALVTLVLLALHAWAFVRFERNVALLMDGLNRDDTARPDDSEKQRAQIPLLVQRYALRAGVPTEPRARSAFLSQTAEMRMAPHKPWRAISATQRIAIRQPGFVWCARQNWGHIPLLRIVDAYVASKGFLKARLFGSIPVADFSGPDADRSELMRYLAELPWVPDAMLHNDSLRWKILHQDIIEVVAKTDDEVVTVRLYFNGDGDVHEIQDDARANTENGKVVPRPWIGRFSDYKEMGGRRLPSRAEVGYVYDSGYSAYWRGEITHYQVE